MLQIKNTLGGGKPEGMYVWKKYKYIHKVVNNPTLSAKVSRASNPFTLVLSSSDFNVKKITANDLGGFVKDDGVNQFKVENGQLKYGNNTIGYKDANYDNSTATITVNTTTNWSGTLSFAYSGEKTFSYSDVGDLIGYVVSDKENAYPDGGEKGGYWYEKVGAKSASGEITFSSAVNTITIEHGLGAKPKYVFLIGIQTNSDSNTYKLINGYKDNESSRIITMQSFSDGKGGFKPTAAVSGELTTSTFAEIEADATNITIPVSYVYKSEVKCIGTYKWFAIA